MSQKLTFSVIYTGMRDVDPKSLIIEAKNGNNHAFGELYRLYFTPVFRYIYTKTWNKEISEDVTQAAFVKAYAGIGAWCDKGKHPLAYFFTIARNVLNDHWRNENSVFVEHAELETFSSPSRSHEEKLERSLSGELLKRSLEELTQDQCDVLTMKYFGELEYEEIAEAIQKNVEAVRQLHSRALKALREKIPSI